MPPHGNPDNRLDKQLSSGNGEREGQSRNAPTARRDESANSPPDGDLDRLMTLFDEHAATIKALLLRMVHDEEVAETLLAESYAGVCGDARMADGDSLPVLVEVAHAGALDWLRKNGNSATSLGADDGESLDAVDPSSPLAKLPPMQRRVLECMFYDGELLPDVARRLDAPPEWIAKAVVNALETLSRAVADDPVGSARGSHCG